MPQTLPKRSQAVRMRDSTPVRLDPKGDAWDVAALGLLQSTDMDAHRRLSPDALQRALRERDARFGPPAAAPAPAPISPAGSAPLAPFQRQQRPWSIGQPGPRPEMPSSRSTPRLPDPALAAPSTPPTRAPTRAPARDPPGAPSRPNRTTADQENSPLRANQSPQAPRPPFGERLLKQEVRDLEEQVEDMYGRLRAAKGTMERHARYKETLERTVGLLSLAIRDKAALGR